MDAVPIDIAIISTDSQGDHAIGGPSSHPSMSADGRFVVFTSYATNLVPNDTNGGPTEFGPDIFVKDRQTGRTFRFSTSSQGRQADNFGAIGSVISGNGQIVAFSASAQNLVPEDNNQFRDIFAKDLQTARTTRLSTSSTGGEGTGAVFWAGGALHPSVSFDGRLIAFDSEFNNLVPADTNGELDPGVGIDVFVKDQQTNQTVRVSTSSEGDQGNGPSDYPSISADGRLVAFQSDASDLIPGDTNAVPDIFVKDRETGETTRVSVSSSGAQSNGESLAPAISADGRFVAFISSARNLARGAAGQFWGVFVRDLQAGRTTSIRTSTPVSTYPEPIAPSLSGDGRYVAFATTIGEIPPGAVAPLWQVIVKDRNTGARTLVSRNSTGQPGNGSSYHAWISADGRSTAFQSEASDLVPSDTNGVADIFVVDLSGSCATSGS
jgi:Tol biopolymer transport system component